MSGRPDTPFPFVHTGLAGIPPEFLADRRKSILDGSGLVEAVEGVTADPHYHSPDLGGTARTQEVTGAAVAALAGSNMLEAEVA